MLDNGRTITTHELYTISTDGDATVALLTWNGVAGMAAKDFADGILKFAEGCLAHEVDKATIDATELDQQCQAVRWLRGTESVDGLDEYNPWWMENIVPIYNDAGVRALVVATGDPNAPGELDQPEQVQFAVHYLTTLEESLALAT